MIVLIWIVQRKKISNRLKHYGRHQLINIDGKPVQQLEMPKMITMPLLTFNYSGLRWVKLKILNEQIHYNIENEYKFLSQVFGAKVIAHKDSGNWITFYFERFKENNPLPWKKSKHLDLHLGVDGFGQDLKVNLKDKSGIRICGRPGSGKSFVLKSIYKQVPDSFTKMILTSKPQEFQQFDATTVFDATDTDRFLEFSQKIVSIVEQVKQKNKKDPIFIFLDEAQQDLRESFDKTKNQMIQDLVENLNFLLGVGRAYEIFLVIATQADTLRDTKLDVRQLPILISGKLHSDYTCDYYGIPKEIGFRDDLHRGKMILADEGNWKIFKAYNPNVRGKS
ncbi:MAG: AAA family ATPase [Bdellovibrionales bacterium]|nr:AAA family ATPase [Bdellovibrionales bacterium]